MKIKAFIVMTIVFNYPVFICNIIISILLNHTSLITLIGMLENYFNRKHKSNKTIFPLLVKLF